MINDVTLQEVARTFLVNFQTGTIRGPRTFWRFGSRNDGAKFEWIRVFNERQRRALTPEGGSFHGRFWFDEQEIPALINLGLQRTSGGSSTRARVETLRAGARQGLAVSREWNPLDSMWRLAVPADEEIAAVWGDTAPQTLFSGSGNAPSNTLPQLPGGVRQYVLPDASECRSWISGPIAPRHLGRFLAEWAG